MKKGKRRKRKRRGKRTRRAAGSTRVRQVLHASNEEGTTLPSTRSWHVPGGLRANEKILCYCGRKFADGWYLFILRTVLCLLWHKCLETCSYVVQRASGRGCMCERSCLCSICIVEEYVSRWVLFFEVIWAGYQFERHLAIE